jgi:hypothetical protein
VLDTRCLDLGTSQEVGRLADGSIATGAGAIDKWKHGNIPSTGGNGIGERGKHSKNVSPRVPPTRYMSSTTTIEVK